MLLNKLKKLATLKKGKKFTSIALTTMLACNMMGSLGTVFANKRESRVANTLTIGQSGSSISYIGDRNGDYLKFPKKKVFQSGDWAFCLEHSLPVPSSNGVQYTYQGKYDDGMTHIVRSNPGTGSVDKDYYVKQAAIHFYHGEVQWISKYAVHGRDLADKAVALANQARQVRDTRSLSSETSLSLSPKSSEFTLNSSNGSYETGWFNISKSGDLISYSTTVNNAPNGTVIVNQDGQVVSSLGPSDTKFFLRAPIGNVSGDYNVSVTLKGTFLVDVASKYAPSGHYQHMVVVTKEEEQREDSISAKLNGTGFLDLIKKGDNGEVLQGAEFKLVQNGVDKTDVKSTDSNGYLRFDNLVPGEYTLVETKAPAGYLPNNHQDKIQIKTGETAKIEVINNIIKGKVKLIKVDSETNQTLKGAEFDLKTLDGKVVEHLVTGDDGSITSGLHTYGKYILKETKAPDKYVLNETEYPVTISENMETVEVTAKNDIIKGKVALHKIDSESKANLQGAEFTIYDKDDKEVAKITTNEQGYGESEPLVIGHYTMKETKAPQGYINNNNKVYDIEITENGKIYTYDIENSIKKGKVDIIKKDSETKRKLKGAEFTIYNKEGKEVDKLVTDENGYGVSKDLRYGDYTMKETKAPDGYNNSEKVYEVKIRENNKTYTYEIENTSLKGNVEIHKSDSEYGNKLAGAEFTIFDNNKNMVERLVTDENGYAKSKDIAYGTYEMQETKPPTGYKPNNTIYKIEIKEGGQLITFDIKNDIIKGNVEINKIDKDTKENIEGVVFTIYNDKKQPVDMISTDQDGYAKSKDLPFGKYTMQETTQREGYKPNPTVYDINITEDKQILTYDIENEMQKGRVEIHKSDSETNRSLAGAEFTIYDLNKNEVDKLVTNDEGYAISKELRFGKYTMTETKSPYGYLPSDKHYEIEINKDGKILTYDIKNDVKKGTVDFSKIDVSTGENLEGAKIQITGLDEINKHINIEFISKKEGNKFELPVGKYQFKEIQAPDGYLLSEEIGKFEIKEDGEVVKAELKNVPKLGEIKIIKVDGNNSKKTLSGAEFTIRDKNNKVVDKIVTGKDGIGISSKLRLGEYTYQETKAPKGYKKDDKIYKFEINEHEQVIEKTMKNYEDKTWIDKLFPNNNSNSGNPQTGDSGIIQLLTIGISALIGLVFINLKSSKLKKQ